MWVLASLLLRPLPLPDPSAPEHPIVVARWTLTPGERIDAEDLVTIDFPPGLLPHTALTRAHDVVGLYVRERVIAGEPLREERLFAPDLARGATVIGLTPERVTVSVSSLDHPALVDRLEGATIVVALRHDIDVSHIETHGVWATPRLVSGRWAEPAPRPPCREPDPVEDLYPVRCSNGRIRLPLCRPSR